MRVEKFPLISRKSRGSTRHSSEAIVFEKSITTRGNYLPNSSDRKVREKRGHESQSGSPQPFSSAVCGVPGRQFPCFNNEVDRTAVAPRGTIRAPQGCHRQDFG